MATSRSLNHLLATPLHHPTKWQVSNRRGREPCSSSSQARSLAKPPGVSDGALSPNTLPLSKSPILGPAGPPACSLGPISVASGEAGVGVTGARSVGPRSGCARQGEGRTPGEVQVKATSKGRELGRAQRETAREQGCRYPSSLSGRDRHRGCPTYNLQADEGTRVGPQDVRAGGQSDPGRREGHGGVRGRRDWRSAGRHAAAAALRLRAPPPPPSARLRRPGSRRRRRRRRSGPQGPGAPRGRGRGRAVLSRAGPRPVTWVQVSAPQPPGRLRLSRAQVRRPPGAVFPAPLPPLALPRASVLLFICFFCPSS